LTVDYAIPYASAASAIAVGVGDLCYWKNQDATYGDVAYPADQFASLGTEALDQAAFAGLFVGVSQEQILASETNKFKRFTVRTDCVCLFKCPSQTFKHGDLVGVYSNGATLDPQQVDLTLNPAAAIGIVIKDYPAATTSVEVQILSRYAFPPSAGAPGYMVGQGGAVTQATSKSTGVTLNKSTGQITLNAAALAAGTTVSFTLTDSVIDATDVVVCCVVSGEATDGSYQVWASEPAAGSVVINVRNVTAGALSEAPVIQYVVIKGAKS
jgi:hypothetical protein